MTQDPNDLSAVVVWLPPGVSPEEDSFDANSVKAPPSPNPEPWWRLSDAVNSVGSRIQHQETHEKAPWIKAGERIFDLDAIRKMWADLNRD